MYKSEFKQKAWSLPVADLLYVGKSTNRKLALFGIKTIGDLARTDEDVLNSHLGKIGSILWSFANGYDDSPVKLENTHAPIKSVGNSTTTPKDLVCDNLFIRYCFYSSDSSWILIGMRRWLIRMLYASWPFPFFNAL